MNLKCALDLASIAQRARNAEYNPKRFAACIVRIKDPKTTALMFNSGKMVIAGAKSEDQSRLAARKVTNHAFLDTPRVLDTLALDKAVLYISPSAAVFLIGCRGRK